MANLSAISLLAMARTSRRWWPSGRVSSISPLGGSEDEASARSPHTSSDISTDLPGEIKTGPSWASELEEEGERQSNIPDGDDQHGIGILFSSRVPLHDRDRMFSMAMESLTGEQKALLLNEVSRISSGELLNANKDLASFLASGASDIDLSGCSLLRPEVCKDMFTSVGSMQLISMNISDCHPYMSGLMLSEVWDHVPRLEKLEFRATSLLFNFNRAIKDLALKCERITHIDMSLSVNLSDDAVSTLLASCRELRVLKVANCPRLTDEAFRLQPISSSLAELEMWGNRAITGQGLLFFESVLMQVTMQMLHFRGLDATRTFV